MLGKFACFFCRLRIFFIKLTFSKHLSGIQSVSNSLDPDQAWHFVGPDLGLNCLQSQQITKVVSGGKRVNFISFIRWLWRHLPITMSASTTVFTSKRNKFGIISQPIYIFSPNCSSEKALYFLLSVFPFKKTASSEGPFLFVLYLFKFYGTNTVIMAFVLHRYTM